MFFEHVRDGAPGYLVSEVVEGTADARVSPGTVLDGHPYDEPSDFLHERRVTRATALAAVVFPRDQLSMPPQEGVRRAERSEVAERPATQGLGFRRQAATLHIGEPQPPRGALLAKDAVFFLATVDDVALLLVDPPSNGDDEALQGLWKRKHTERAYQRWVATMKAAA